MSVGFEGLTSKISCLGRHQMMKFDDEAIAYDKVLASSEFPYGNVGKCQSNSYSEPIFF